MSPYLVALVLHVLTAVLGLGLVPAVVLVAGAELGAPKGKIVLMRRLARGASLALAVMLLTGFGILVATHGAGADSWWLRVSFVLLLVAGAMLGQVQRALRIAEKDPEHGLALVRRFGLVASVCLGGIVVLMQAKPF